MSKLPASTPRISIKDASGAELIPKDIQIGYDEPRDYLPDVIITLLDTDS